MKETAKDGASFVGVSAKDGWHEVEVQDGIDYVQKDGNVYMDDKGNKAWKIPLKVAASDEDSAGATIGCTAFEANGGDLMATILEAAGLWKTICEKFPGDDVSVFDAKIMSGVKTKLPGKSFMVESKVDKNGFAKVVSVASFAKYKEIKAEGKGAAKGKSAKSETKADVKTDSGADW